MLEHAVEEKAFGSVPYRALLSELQELQGVNSYSYLAIYCNGL
jgi:hypothetical protein